MGSGRSNPMNEEMTQPDRAHLNIVPLGVVDDLAVAVVAANLQALMGLNTDVGPRQPVPDYAYLHGRRQYDAAKIIHALASAADTNSLTLGVTRHDICTPILTFVFGESQLGGRAALISLNRMTLQTAFFSYHRPHIAQVVLSTYCLY